MLDINLNPIVLNDKQNAQFINDSNNLTETVYDQSYGEEILNFLKDEVVNTCTSEARLSTCKNTAPLSPTLYCS